MVKLDSEKLFGLLAEQDRSIAWLARAVDLSYVYCWRLVYNKNINPTLSTLGKLAEALNVDARELIITEESHG